MDSLIKRFDYVEDDDLCLCHSHGVAYQKDMTIRVPYDEDYFNKCLGYEDQDIANKINEGRIRLVRDYLKGNVIDIGIGSGEFIKKRPCTYGYDINPTALQWLADNGYYRDNLDEFKAFTFWDVIEHIQLPNNYFKHIKRGSFAFFSIPVFTDLNNIRQSKHYRPGEHLYYWTEQGFREWMRLYQFRFMQLDDFEIKAGRENIYSFAFKKDLQDYHDTLNQYVLQHEDHYYGGSAIIYLDYVKQLIINLNPKSILDYGCGRSELAVYFWNDGKRRIERYDPAINIFKPMPEGQFDLVICCDVMEHILMGNVDQIFNEIKKKSNNVIFVISTKPARAVLPDGRNAHVTLLTKSEWTRWIEDVFGKADEVKTEWDHVLMLKTW